VERLRRENYISTMSLIRRTAFPGWDESVLRLQDYDLWLTMSMRGYRGAYVPRVLFAALYVDKGITRTDGYADALRVVHRKHGICA
jgi:hypothetical protein